MKQEGMKKTLSWVLDQLKPSGILVNGRSSESSCNREDFYSKDLELLRKEAEDILHDETRRLVHRHEEAVLNAEHDAADAERSFIRLAVQYSECMRLYAERKKAYGHYLRSSTQSAHTVSTERPSEISAESKCSVIDPADMRPEDILDAVELGILPEDYV